MVKESSTHISEGIFGRSNNAESEKDNNADSFLSDGKEETIVRLSGRQRQMLDAIVNGMQYKEIAFEYGISENTVAFHISKLKERLNCGSSREIISAAILNGLIPISRPK